MGALSRDYGLMPMRVLGIDLAAQAKRTYGCILDDADGVLEAELHPRCADAAVFDLARDTERVAIYAPFGWPVEFVDALNAHQAFEPWPAPNHENPDAFRASLSFRATDRVVMHTRRPLSVSTDKLGATAMRCAYLLDRWSAEQTVDRTGMGKFVEVYPAGALARWDLTASGYKGANHASLGSLLSKLCAVLPALRLSDADSETCATVDDAFDALVAALVARAALLGLTDGPQDSQRARAEREGWIHLPARGSLRFLARGKHALVARPAGALAQKLRNIGVEVDAKGYVQRTADALLPTFSAATRAAIEADLGGKRGSELVGRPDRRAKFYAAHSSAALAANTFGPFLREHTPVPIGRCVYEGQVALEAECPTGLRGTPPTLDCLVDGPEILAVESKCLETFSTHAAHFKDGYADAIKPLHPSWRKEYGRLAEDPTRYRYLDAAQLIKHYLGLRTTYPGRPVTLAYLYWVPTNADDLAPCSIHAAEIAEFAKGLHDPSLRFVASSYSKVWADWSSPDKPAWLRDHATALRDRYSVAVLPQG
jgi:hypothetical protein